MNPKNKKVLSLFLIVFIAITFIVTGCSLKKEDAQTKEEAVAVETKKIVLGDIDDVTKLSGRIEAEDAVDVVSKIPGKVAEVLCEVGDYVEKGEPLVVLETNELQAQMAQAQAALAAARANLSANESGVLPQQVEQVRASYEQAKANYNNAKADYGRMKALYEADAIAKQAFDGMTLKYEVAKTQYETAKEQLRLTQGRVPKNVETLRAQVAQAEAAVQLIQTNIDNSVIRAPISGEVSMRMVEPGEMAAAGYPLASLVNVDNVKVVIDVSEEEINKVEDGQEAEIKVDALEEEEPMAGIVSIVPPASNPTRLFQVKIDIENPDHKLKPGMFADVDIVTGTRENVVVAPKDSILIKKHGNIAYVVKDGKAEERIVNIGVSNGKNVEITKGLKKGEQLVVKGQNLLKEGTLVKTEK